MPATHEALAAHCASLVHAEEAHAVPLQAAPPHEVCTGAGHAPAPLQDAASVITPFEQESARHCVAPSGYAHCAGSLPPQVPPHAPQLELQHTPSTHWPLAHWFAPAHALPLVRSGMQTPPEQKSPKTQSVSLVQLPRQAVGPHT
jgi:hypothetical protein